MRSGPRVLAMQSQEMNAAGAVGLEQQPTTHESQIVNPTSHVHKTSRYPIALGSCADLYKGKSMQHDGKIVTVVIKAIRGCVSDSCTISSEELYNNLIREAIIWRRLDHPNITPFFGVQFDSDLPSFPWIILPYYAYGNVMQYLRNHPSKDRIRLVRQVAAGLSYLHNIPFVHGDIKSTNVLINDEGEACLVDYGLSRVLEDSGFTTTYRGSLRWMAPELATALVADEDPQATTNSDVWAFAMTVLEMLTSRLPFLGTKQDTALIHIITAGVLPLHKDYPEVNDDVWGILLRCWQMEPARRPSIHDISLHFDGN